MRQVEKTGRNLEGKMFRGQTDTWRVRQAQRTDGSSRVRQAQRTDRYVEGETG